MAKIPAALSLAATVWGVGHVAAHIKNVRAQQFQPVASQTALKPAEKNLPEVMLQQHDNTRIYQSVTVHPPQLQPAEPALLAPEPDLHPAEPIAETPDVDAEQYVTRVSQAEKDIFNIVANNAENKRMSGKNLFFHKYLGETAAILYRLKDPNAVMAEINPDAPGWDSLSDEEKRDMADYTVNAFHEARGEGLEGMCAVSESVRLRTRDNHQKRGTTVREQIASLAQYSWMGDENVLQRLTSRTEKNKDAWQNGYKAAAFARLGGKRAVQLGILTPQEATSCEATLAKIPNAKDYFNPAKASPGWAKTMAKTHKSVKIGNHLFLVPKQRTANKGR